MIYVDVEMIKSAFLKSEISGAVISSLIVMGIILILALIIFFKARKADPLKKPKGILFIAEVGVSFFDQQVEDLMGPRFKGFGGYIMAIAVYTFLGFIFGLTGLPSPFTYMVVPLSLGLSTFIMIHATSVRYTKLGYFKRYIDPFPVFLPINLISMWAPLLSMTLRLFGNAIAGWTIMSIVYACLEQLNAAIFSFLPITEAGNWNSVVLTSIVPAVLHLYFDLFSALIQTMVFMSLTMIFIGQEAPDDLMEQVEK